MKKKSGKNMSAILDGVKVLNTVSLSFYTSF